MKILSILNFIVFTQFPYIWKTIENKENCLIIESIKLTIWCIEMLNETFGTLFLTKKVITYLHA